MIDIHAHVLPGVDDGADSVDTSLEMLRQASSDGTTAVFCTPHILDVGEIISPDDIRERVKQLQNAADHAGIPIELFPGSEVMLSDNLGDRLKENILTTLGDSPYILVELPMHDIPFHAESTLFELTVSNLIPILAHPERNTVLMRDPSRLYQLVQNGVLTQVNAGSLSGLFGEEVKNFALDLINCRQVHFIGSDGHSVRRRRLTLSEGRKMVEDILGESAKPLTVDNPKAIIEGRELSVPAPLPYKRRRKSFWSFSFR